MSDIWLVIIFITNVGLFLFFGLVLIGLIKTRRRTGNTITNGMILERVGLVLFWLWNISITVANTSPFFDSYHDLYRDNLSLPIRAAIGVFLMGAVVYTLLGD